MTLLEVQQNIGGSIDKQAETLIPKNSMQLIINMKYVEYIYIWGLNNKTACSHPHLIAHHQLLSLLTLFSNLITSAVPHVTALCYISNTLYSLLSKRL